MTANTAPIFTKTPNVQLSGVLNSGTILGPSANTAMDGTGACYPIFQAQASPSDGSWVDRIVLKPIGSPAATVARLFLCDVAGAFTPGTTNTASNCVLLDEVTLGAVTASNTAAQNQTVIPCRFQLKAGQRLLLTFGTSTGPTGTGYVATVFGGDY